MNQFDGLLVLAHYVLSLALLWSCFCRFTYTSKATTRITVRWALNLLAAASVFSLAYPLTMVQEGRPWVPDVVHLVMLFAITVVQLTTAVLWHRGVPHQFLKGKST